MRDSSVSITVNGRDYLWPKQPTVVVCIDGSERAYIDRAVEAGVLPWTARILSEGSDLPAHCVVPCFTNPNNLSIVTGVSPPSVHGICGNFFHDPGIGRYRGHDERPEVPSHRHYSRRLSGTAGGEGGAW